MTGFRFDTEPLTATLCIQSPSQLPTHVIIHLSNSYLTYLKVIMLWESIPKTLQNRMARTEIITVKLRKHKIIAKGDEQVNALFMILRDGFKLSFQT